MHVLTDEKVWVCCSVDNAMQLSNNQIARGLRPEGGDCGGNPKWSTSRIYLIARQLRPEVMHTSRPHLLIKLCALQCTIASSYLSMITMFRSKVFKCCRYASKMLDFLHKPVPDQCPYIWFRFDPFVDVNVWSAEMCSLVVDFLHESLSEDDPDR